MIRTCDRLANKARCITGACGPVTLQLFCDRGAEIFSAAFRGPAGFADYPPGLRPDLHHLAALTSSVHLRGFVRALGAHIILPADTAVAPDNAFVHVHLPFYFIIPS